MTAFTICFDQQASTRQVLNDSADIADEFVYRAFGRRSLSRLQQRTSISSGKVGPFTEADDRIWMRVRQYGRQLGLWMSPDSLIYGSFNLYEFVNNNPIMFIDGSGQAPVLSAPAYDPLQPSYRSGRRYPARRDLASQACGMA